MHAWIDYLACSCNLVCINITYRYKLFQPGKLRHQTNYGRRDEIKINSTTPGTTTSPSWRVQKTLERIIVTDPEEADIEQSKVIAGLLEDELKILNKLHEEILHVCDAKKIQTEIEESAKTSHVILTTKRKIETYFKLFKQKVIKDLEPGHNRINTVENITNSSVITRKISNMLVSIY